MPVEIRNRYSNEIIRVVDADTLRDADLVGAYLRGADLRGADLRGADLVDAKLVDAKLVGADLRGADLRGAYLRGADLRGADLVGAKINWQSHDLIAEILRQEARTNIERRMLAGLILISRDWCWKEFLAIQHSEKEWALGVLRAFAAASEQEVEELR